MNIRDLIRIALIISVWIYHPLLHAELLIMKQTDEGLMPLDENDKKNCVKIEEILLNYQWPMSAAHAFDTPDQKEKLFAETGDLFKADQPNAEQLFIENKIKEETKDKSYRVIFVPTALYELFIISIALNPNASNPIRKALGNMAQNNLHNISLNDILEEESSKQQKYLKIKNRYHSVNKIFYSGPDGAFFYLNKELGNKIKESISALDSGSLEAITKELINNIRKFENNFFLVGDIPLSMPSTFSFEEDKHKSLIDSLINRVITLEFEAQKINKGLLLRGSSFFTFEKIGDPKEQSSKILAGSTLYTLTEAIYYKEDAFSSYSVSFGNSLFAGLLFDKNACALTYLCRKPHTGYSLFINKKEYIDNFNSDLLFIAPLSTLAGVFSKGEWFHSRTKAAIKKKKEDELGHIFGLSTPLKKDSDSIITTTKDPFKHASLFSTFIAKNGVIITDGNLEGLSQEEKTSISKILETQAEAAGYYKGIKRIKEWGKNAFSTEAKEKRHNKVSNPTQTFIPSPLRALQLKQEQVAREELRSKKQI